MKSSRPGATRDVVLLVIAIALLVAAGIYVTQGGDPQDAAPDDQYLEFECQACGESFRLNYAEFEKLWNERRFTRQDDGRTLLYECPKCGQREAVRKGRSGWTVPPRPRPE